LAYKGGEAPQKKHIRKKLKVWGGTKGYLGTKSKTWGEKKKKVHVGLSRVKWHTTRKGAHTGGGGEKCEEMEVALL